MKPQRPRPSKIIKGRMITGQIVEGQARQRGAALAVTLILLLVLTLSVLSSSQNVVMQERMSAGQRDTTVSLAAAEAAVTEAEQFVETLTSLNAFGVTPGLYAIDTGPADVFDSANWTDAKSIVANTSIGGTVTRYFVQDAGVISEAGGNLAGVNILGYGETAGGGDINVFKIVSRASGQSGNAERVVVSYYGKRL